MSSNIETQSENSESSDEGTKNPSPSIDIQTQANNNDSNNQKTEHESVSDNNERLMFQRLWTDDDVIVILKGIIGFKAKKKYSPNENMNAFLKFVKKKLSVDFNKNQLGSKIKSLKAKYVSNKRKTRVLSKPHEVECYELCEKIWGKEIGVMSEKSKVVKRTRAMEEKMLRVGAELFEGDEEIEGSREWRKLRVEDTKLSLRKLDVMRECMRLVLDKF